MAWDDDKKAQAIQMYQDAEPTPANSIEIVSDIAEQLEESANGVRRILTLAGVYVKKEGASKPAAASGDKPASTRVSKEAAQGQLTAAIEATGQEVDSDIVSKLTGKAALYFANILTAK